MNNCMQDNKNNNINPSHFQINQKALCPSLY